MLKHEMTNSDLLTQANAKFNVGANEQGLKLLREYNQTNTNDAASCHRQAVIEEQIGSQELAGLAHFQCIEIAPNNAVGYLYAGYWLQNNSDDLTAAASLYSLAFDIDTTMLALWNNPNTDQATKFRLQNAQSTVRYVLSEHHRKICSQFADADRISESIWVQTSQEAPVFNVDQFAPELFYIPNIKKKPIYADTEFEWTDVINNAQQKIQSELKNFLEHGSVQKNMRPYLSDQFANHASLGKLAGSTNWQAIDLYKNGQLNNSITSSFPETLKALAMAPCYQLDNTPFEAFFSFLKPKQSIAEHYGESNHSLTVHLPLEIPKNCYLNVANEKKAWQENELLIFDDSFLHSAHNNSDDVRVVLIFSIWHPDLSSQERKAIQASFVARQQILSERRSYLRFLRSPSKT